MYNVQDKARCRRQYEEYGEAMQPWTFYIFQRKDRPTVLS